MIPIFQIWIIGVVCFFTIVLLIGTSIHISRDSLRAKIKNANSPLLNILGSDDSESLATRHGLAAYILSLGSYVLLLLAAVIGVILAYIFIIRGL